MSKKWKRIFRTLSLATPLSLPLVVLSAENNASASNNTNPEKPTKPEAPKEPTNDPNFNTFSSEASDKLKEMVSGALNAFESYVNDEIGKAEKFEDDYKKQLSKITYLKIVDSYIKKHKQEIQENPIGKGLNFLFPKMISTNRNVNVSEIKIGEKTYSNVWTGLSSPTDYVTAAGQGAEFKVIEGNRVNDFNEERFKKSLEQYGKELSEKSGSLFYDDADVPELDKDVFLNFEKLNDKNGYIINPPKNFNSWDDYIISKIKPRVLDFDLEMNIKLTQDEEEEKEKKVEEEEDLPAEDQNPEDKVLDPTKKDEVFQGIPPLSPEVKFQYADKTLDQISKLISSGTHSSEVFFFKNPINTRYIYTVTKTELQGNNLVATVELKDSINTESKRSFEINVVKDTPETALLKESLYESIQSVYGSLYSALGIDSRIDYEKLASQSVSDALFHIIDSGVKLINTEKIVNEFNKAIDVYKPDVHINNGSIANVKLINDFKANMRELLLTALKTSSINNLPYFFSLVNGINSKKSKLWIRMKRDEKLPGKLSEREIDPKEIDEFYQNLETKIYKLRKTTDLSTFNVSKWYDKFINDLKTSSDELLLLQEVIEDQNIQENPDEPNTEESKKQNQAEKYNSLKEINRQTRQQNSNINRNLGIGLFVIGTIGSIVNAVSLVASFMLKKSKQYKKLTILLSIVFGTILVIGLVLLILGVKGI
ncbi:MSC_0620 family F1-like ATPase-associated subunit [Mycoplasmopsis edwardii]|nr:hypothetical protein [Mycoplasmopsis edwardii]